MYTDCWIIGSAPGLNRVDVCKLKDRPTIAFNRSYIAWDEWGFDPWHYCVIDLRVLRSIRQDVNKLVERQACRSYHFYDGSQEWGRRLVKETPETFFYALQGGWGFDPEKPYYCGDVAAFSLQVAYELGYRRVFVVGVDLRWSGRENMTAKTAKRRVAREDNDTEHFRADYYPAGMEYSNPWPEAHFRSWSKSVEKAQAYGLEIVSCTPWSRLNELVDYVKFEDVLLTTDYQHDK